MYRTFVVLLTLLRTAPKRAAFLANIDIVNQLLLGGRLSRREQRGQTRAVSVEGGGSCDVVRLSGVVDV